MNRRKNNPELTVKAEIKEKRKSGRKNNAQEGHPSRSQEKTRAESGREFE